MLNCIFGLGLRPYFSEINENPVTFYFGPKSRSRQLMCYPTRYFIPGYTMYSFLYISIKRNIWPLSLTQFSPPQHLVYKYFGWENSFYFGSRLVLFYRHGSRGGNDSHEFLLLVILGCRLHGREKVLVRQTVRTVTQRRVLLLDRAKRSG